MSGAQGRATQRCARWEVARVHQDSRCKMQEAKCQATVATATSSILHLSRPSTCDPSTSPGRRWGLHLLHRAERKACEPLRESGVSLLTLSPALRRPCILHLEPCTWAQSQHRDVQVFQVTTRDAQVFRVTTIPCVRALGCPWVLPVYVPATGWSHPEDDSAPQALGLFWGWDPGHYGAEARHPTVAFLCSQHIGAMTRASGCFSSLILGW